MWSKKWRQKELLVQSTAEAINSIIRTGYEYRLEQETIQQALDALAKTATKD